MKLEIDLNLKKNLPELSKKLCNRIILYIEVKIITDSSHK